MRARPHVYRGDCPYHCLGCMGPCSPLLRYLAAHHQHGTTIVTFLMVFLIQNTQNRDTAAIQLKLDELIRANENARNKMLSLEDLTEGELKQLKESLAATIPVEAIREPLEAAQQGLEDVSEGIEKVKRRLP